MAEVLVECWALERGVLELEGLLVPSLEPVGALRSSLEGPQEQLLQAEWVCRSQVGQSGYSPVPLAISAHPGPVS